MRNRSKYPRDWKRMSTECKERAGWQCEECYVPHGTKRVSRHSGREYSVYLQAAHVNHDKHNEQPVLKAVCAYCHWHFYRLATQLPRWFIEKLKHRKLLKEKGYLQEI